MTLTTLITKALYSFIWDRCVDPPRADTVIGPYLSSFTLNSQLLNEPKAPLNLLTDL